ncbi:MAG: hypothetical protein JSS65_00810 [Armatimonadetes bacterium]|nr:hypothetical protein [Armatimonadota bacterium]
MNANRAREMFSQYHEGEADAHSAKVFERALEQDPALRQEYDEFVRAVELLSQFADEPVEIPSDLHEKISARLDNHVWEKKQAGTKKLFGLPSWASGLLATAAVACAVFAVVNRQQEGPGSHGDPLGPIVAKPKPAATSFAYVQGQVHLQVSAERPVEITVKRTADDKVEGKYSVPDKGTEVDAPLVNNEAKPVGLTVRVSDGQPPMFLVLPGKDRETESTGDGDLSALAHAVAAHFGTPVVLISPTTATKTYHWSFTEKDQAKDLVQRLSDVGVGAEILSSGLLRLQEGA